jgi:formylglycine-generating enzyme required for sulfatase activity
MTTRLPIHFGTIAAVLALWMLPQHSRATLIDYPLVTVGNAGNADNETTGLGGVDFEFRIGKYDVTIQQYADFLNAVAKSDSHSLYDTQMAADLNIAGIARSGASGSYTYSVMDNFGSSANRPITYVSWFDAARFVNWMANGQPTDLNDPDDATENGAYDLASAEPGFAPQKNAINPHTGAPPTYYLPTEDQFYKAAYFSPNRGDTGVAGYFLYAAQSDTTPGNVVGSCPNQVNIYRGVYSFTQSSIYTSTQNYLTDVGAFSGSPGFYGTFDMNGNVYQWNDLAGTTSASRGLIAGFWFGGPSSAMNTTVASQTPTYAGNDTGFRLAAPALPPSPTCGVAMTVSKSETRATFTIVNTGDTETRFRLSRSQQISNTSKGPKTAKPSGTSPIVITYTLAGANITNAFSAGTAATTIPAGDSAQVVVKAKARTRIAFKRTIKIRLTAQCEADSSKSASAKATLTLKKTK